MLKRKKSTSIIREVIPRLLKSSLRIDLQFPQLPDASPDPILVTNTKGTIYYVNPAWEKLTGYTFEEAGGKNPRFLQSGKTPKKVYTAMWKKLLKGQHFSTDEIINKKKTGQEFQVHATYFPVKKRGKNRFYVQMFHDITHRKTIERQKEAFVGIASHELKTPITALSAYTQILQRRLKEKIDKKDLYFFENMQLQIDRLTSLINDLLNVSRLESGRVEIHHEVFDLQTLARRIIVDFQYATDDHEIVMEGTIQGKVRGDIRRIEEVLINLLINAIKYSPQANKIIVRLANDKRDAIISVQDFGFGISKKDRVHIFEQFYRTKDKEEGKVVGFGLGLYICKQLMKRNKGKIWVESKKGKGSLFFFSLPLVKVS